MSDTPVRLADINRMMEMVPHLSALGIRAERLDRDAAVLRLPYRAELVAYEDTGVLAGGAIYSLIDSASGMAVFARLGVFEPIATLDLRLDYLKPAEAGRDVCARMECYRLTRSVAFVRGAAYHDSIDDAIAHATGIFMRAAPPPGGDPRPGFRAAGEVGR